MRKPDTATIPTRDAGSSYTQSPAEAAPSKTVSKETRPGKAMVRIQKTYSMEKAHVDLINQYALKLGMERGEPVSASEALRLIMNQFQASEKSSRQPAPAEAMS